MQFLHSELLTYTQRNLLLNRKRNPKFKKVYSSQIHPYVSDTKSIFIAFILKNQLWTNTSLNQNTFLDTRLFEICLLKILPWSCYHRQSVM